MSAKAIFTHLQTLACQDYPTSSPKTASSSPARHRGAPPPRLPFKISSPLGQGQPPVKMASLPTVTIYLKRDIDKEKIKLGAPISRAKLIAHSECFQRLFAHNPSCIEVILPAGAPGALIHVLESIQNHRGRHEFSYLEISGMGLLRAIAVWEAAWLLNVKPVSARHRLMGYLNWHLSHAHGSTTPDVMEAVQKVFAPSASGEDPERRRPWDAMIAR